MLLQRPDKVNTRSNWNMIEHLVCVKSNVARRVRQRPCALGVNKRQACILYVQFNNAQRCPRLCTYLRVGLCIYANDSMCSRFSVPKSTRMSNAQVGSSSSIATRDGPSMGHVSCHGFRVQSDTVGHCAQCADRAMVRSSVFHRIVLIYITHDGPWHRPLARADFRF